MLHSVEANKDLKVCYNDLIIVFISLMLFSSRLYKRTYVDNYISV